MDTNDRLKRLLKERGWTEYRLSKTADWRKLQSEIFLGEIPYHLFLRWKLFVKALVLHLRSFLPRAILLN